MDPKLTMMTATKSTEDFMGDPYFMWLCHRVDIDGGRHPYREMAMQLHRMAFSPTVVIQSDMDRANDGLMLRVEFMEKYGASGSSTNRGRCTMLEFLVGISRRMSFLMGEENQPSKTPYYFWKLVKNLDLMKASDGNPEVILLTEDAVNRVLDRAYDSDGRGGMFPLRWHSEDQRNVEIWYQMQAWLFEHCSIEVE